MSTSTHTDSVVMLNKYRIFSRTSTKPIKLVAEQNGMKRQQPSMCPTSCRTYMRSPETNLAPKGHESSLPKVLPPEIRCTVSVWPPSARPLTLALRPPCAQSGIFEKIVETTLQTGARSHLHRTTLQLSHLQHRTTLFEYKAFNPSLTITPSAIGCRTKPKHKRPSKKMAHHANPPVTMARFVSRHHSFTRLMISSCVGKTKPRIGTLCSNQQMAKLSFATNRASLSPLVSKRQIRSRSLNRRFEQGCWVSTSASVLNSRRLNQK